MREMFYYGNWPWLNLFLLIAIDELHIWILKIFHFKQRNNNLTSTEFIDNLLPIDPTFLTKSSRG